MFDGKNVRSGIERVRRETYGFLADRVMFSTLKKICINVKTITKRE